MSSAKSQGEYLALQKAKQSEKSNLKMAKKEEVILNTLEEICRLSTSKQKVQKEQVPSTSTSSAAGKVAPEGPAHKKKKANPKVEKPEDVNKNERKRRLEKRKALQRKMIEEADNRSRKIIARHLMSEKVMAAAVKERPMPKPMAVSDILKKSLKAPQSRESLVVLLNKMRNSSK